jgi:hypothetical protein
MLRQLVTLMLILGASFHAWAGPSEDKLLLDAAFELDIPAIKGALAKGANPNAYMAATLRAPHSVLRRSEGRSKRLRLPAVIEMRLLKV